MTDPSHPDRVPPASLLDRLAGGTTAAVTFAGQGRSSLDDLAALVVERPLRRELVRTGSAILSAFAAEAAVAATGRYRHGFDVEAWADRPDAAPDLDYRGSAAVSYPLNLLTQMVLWDTLVEDGIGAAFDAGSVVGVTGHSQGLLAALVVAEDPTTPIDDDRLERALRLAATMGLALSSTRRPPIETAGGRLTPMAAVRGATVGRVDEVLERVNRGLPVADHVHIALHNASDQVVVAGPPSSLAFVRAELDTAAWEPLPVEVAFHTPALADALAAFLASTDVAALLPDLAAVPFAVRSPIDGCDLRRSPDLAEAVARSQFTDPVRWGTTVSALVEGRARWVLDVGPGTEVARLTTAALRGTGTRTLALASPEGRRLLFTPGAAPTEPALDYERFRPRLVRRPDGSDRIDNAFTRATGQPPFVLAGMTPTTADPAIVTAAANAGFAAELAGGGQVTPELFDLRMAELVATLEPGRQVVFNTLLLDPYLWDLHLGSQQLVARARRAGAPLAGVTVSAGVPDVDEGVALLDRLVGLGLRQNAFKPGTVDQVRRALAIADAAPQHTVFLHLEGGRAGGHHSWEDLDELLLATYHDIRLRSNVILCVGGGIGRPERATELLTGSWSAAHDRAPLPVDAVLLGTVAMACREATASPAVKQALVEATADSVVSGRSHLGADIHHLDNHAARVSRLLDDLARDPEGIDRRRDEIVTALAGTARPYFGDLDAMTYLDVLRRLTELCATGTHRPVVDDGAWGDGTWRSRALELYRRFGARLDAADQGPVPLVVATRHDLDDPAEALDRFRQAHPRVGSLLLHPADSAFVLEVFGRVGKPLPFVPVIDRDLRRWYGTDSLWQAQDERYAADAVLVIPGPDAVAGITRMDEPVAELLARFDEHARAALDDETSRDRVLGRGLAPAAVADAVGEAAGPVAAFCLTAAFGLDDAQGASEPNPLWDLVRPGDQVGTECDDDGRLTWLVVVPAGARVGEAVEVRMGDDGIELATTLPWVDGTLRRTSRQFEVVADPAGWRFVELARDVSLALATRAGLVAEDRPLTEDDWHAPFDLVERPWQLDASTVASYAAVTGARHDGTPLDLAFTLAWPALRSLLAEGPLACVFARLLHRAHAVSPGPAWPPQPGERGIAAARLVELRTTDDGQELEIRVDVSGDRGSSARVDMTAFVVGSAVDEQPERWWHDIVDVSVDLATTAEITWFADQPWVGAIDVELVPGDRVQLRIDLVSQHAGGNGLHRAAGEIWRGDELLTYVHASATGAGDHPVRVAIDLLTESRSAGGRVADGGRGPVVTHATPARSLGSIDDDAPPVMDAFALIGGDTNPLHRSVLAARAAGLDGPIVHGLWTAARAGAAVVDEVAGGDASRLVGWRVDFLAPLAVGAPITLDLTRTGLSAGGTEVVVVVEGPSGPVARATARVAPPRTAIVFPGQGVQRQGIGLDGYERSAAARRIWDQADAVTRRRLGFSVLEVVRDNPTELALGHDRVLRHPSGVLDLTQVTQVVLAVLAAAQVAELREAGVLPDDVATAWPDVIVAGHSLGEFNALAALGVLPLDTVVELVFRRGEAMQAEVPRDGEGRSPYRLAVVDPSRSGLCHDGLELLVDRAAAESGELVEIVNHNAAGRQYAVAGSAAGLDALTRLLEAEAEPGASVLLAAPGIDVPFHSSVLAPAVEGFRAVLDALVPEVEADRLRGRYVSNVIAEPFAPESGRSAREQLIDLLASQLAAPVRWIETQALVLSTVDRVIEIGPAASPVLTNLARTTLGAGSFADPHPRLLHAELDIEVLRGLDVDPDPDPEPADGLATPAVAEPVVPAPVASASAPTDVPLDAPAALLALLALQGRVRADQIVGDESIDRLFEGVSSRRNQVLVDLGKEFGLSGIDGAHEVPIDRLAVEIVERSPRYRYPGPYLRDAVAAGVVRGLGRSGLSRREAAEHLTSTWGLGPGLVERVLLAVALDTREGPSARGGALAALGPDAPADAAAGRDLLDRAVASVGTALGQVLHPVRTEGSGVVDAAAVGALRTEIADAVVDATRQLASALGRPLPVDGTAVEDADPDGSLARLAVLDAALGVERAAEVAPRFDARRHVAFTSSWAAPRWDLVRLYHDALDGRRPDPELRSEAQRLAPHAGDPVVAATVAWLVGRAAARGRDDVVELLGLIGPAPADGATPPGDSLATSLDGVVDADVLAVADELRVGEIDLGDEVALVTGASPGSIAVAAVRVLLRNGARVVVATSTDTPERRRFYRDLYQRDAAPGAELHVVPANLASFADVDDLVAWTHRPATGIDRHRPDPFVVTTVLPFAAVPTIGTLPEAGAAAELSLRVQLLGIERLVGRLAEQGAATGRARRFRVVLPLSPNHGDFGGDLPYGETKAALEALLHRHRSESGWPDLVHPVAARLGWVRGTGLMVGNDDLVDLVEPRLGIRTFSSGEMGALVAALALGPDRTGRSLPDDVDLTGGLAAVEHLRDALQPLGEELATLGALDRRRAELDAAWAARTGVAGVAPSSVAALPAPRTSVEPPVVGPWPDLPPGTDPSQLVVVVGTGELGPGGSVATRFELELGVELSPEAVAELAWMCGLVRFEHGGQRSGWIDVARDEPVEEADLWARYADEVRQRIGIRPLETDAVIDADGTLVYTTAHLDRAITFAVSTEAEAATYVAADPARTTVRVDDDGQRRVTLAEGAVVHVPRRAPLPRGVAAQFPRGLDLAAWGVPPDMLAGIDRMALVDLVTTAEAFLRAGLDPEELLASVHPALVANVQGAGQGGMASLRRMLVDNLLDGARQPDRLQETLVNVMAAHTVQSLVGSYGPMVHPVAACATAAVSVEEAVDKITTGRALVAVAGGFDDITPDGVIGFADMAATADTDEMAAMGLAPAEMSRSNDQRRKGFVEAQGGGSLLLVRGDVALDLGLPVQAVVAYAASFGDGINASIPAPGLGLLAAARGGIDSPLGRSLTALGLTADDIAVVSKHDTSTEINDPNEADLHHRIQEALGRTPGNPLLVVSQKTVTGHAKGGAAAWQLAGLIQVMASSRVPGNRNLDNPDPLLRASSHLAVGDRTIDLASDEPVRAALLSSLGFGHVSALVALVHPDAFVAAVPAERRAAYLERAGRRRAVGERDRLAIRHGRPAFAKRTDRRIEGATPEAVREREAAMLLDPDGRPAR